MKVTTKKTKTNHEQERYESEFRRRLVAIRKASGMSQVSLAKALGLSRDTYSKYEFRSMLPTYLIPKVVVITGFDPWHVLTGQPASKSPTLVQLLHPPADKAAQKIKESVLGHHKPTKVRPQ